MKRHAMLAALVLTVFGMAACDDEDPIDPGEQTDEVVGTWISQGQDLSPGLVAAFSIDSIVATFEEDQTYEVLQYAGGSAQAVPLRGTYVAGDQPEGQIRSITLTQTFPTALTAEGIFEVSGDAMRYEVIQTQPDIGATAPTVSGGFGSTVSGGTATDIWIQNYDRVD